MRKSSLIREDLGGSHFHDLGGSIESDLTTSPSPYAGEGSKAAVESSLPKNEFAVISFSHHTKFHKQEA